MFTTVASSTTMSWATATITRMSQRWSLRAARWLSAIGDVFDMAAIPPGAKRDWFGWRWPRGPRRSCRDDRRAGGGRRDGQRASRIVQDVEQAEKGGPVLLAQGA